MSAGKRKRVLIGRYPTISAQAATTDRARVALRDGAAGLARRFRSVHQPCRQAMEAYLLAPSSRSEVHKQSDCDSSSTIISRTG